MGRGVEEARAEEQGSEDAFAHAEALVEEQGQKRRRQEPAGQAVEREQRRDAPEHAARLRGDARLRFAVRGLDAAGEAQIERGRHEHQERVDTDARPERGDVSAPHPPQDGRQARQESPGGVADVLQDVVPGERLRAPSIVHRGRQDDLVQDQGRPAVASHSVHHPQEGGGAGGEWMRREGEADPPAGAEERKKKKRAPAADAITHQRDQERGRGAAGQPGPDHVADAGRVEVQVRQEHAHEDADHPGRQGPHERGRVQNPAIGHPGRPGDATRGMGAS